jgi:hypothetical protein
VGHEDGSDPVTETNPSWGNKELRQQLKVLKRFMEQLDFIHMKSDTSIVQTATSAIPPTVFAAKDQVYALYFETPPVNGINLNIKPGQLSCMWMDPASGKILELSETKHTGKVFSIRPPAGDYVDVVLKIERN